MKRKIKRDKFGVASGILAYINDKELNALMLDLEGIDVNLGADVSIVSSPKSKDKNGAEVEFYLTSERCDPNNPYWIGETTDLRSSFIEIADNIRDWTEDNKWGYESFIDCFGVGARKHFVSLVDKHLSE